VRNSQRVVPEKGALCFTLCVCVPYSIMHRSHLSASNADWVARRKWLPGQLSRSSPARAGQGSRGLLTAVDEVTHDSQSGRNFSLNSLEASIAEQEAALPVDRVSARSAGDMVPSHGVR
jgi:hypothetical protein